MWAWCWVCRISWSWSYRQLWVIVWVLGIEPGKSSLTTEPSLQPLSSLFLCWGMDLLSLDIEASGILLYSWTHRSSWGSQAWFPQNCVPGPGAPAYTEPVMAVVTFQNKWSNSIISFFSISFHLPPFFPPLPLFLSLWWGCLTVLLRMVSSFLGSSNYSVPVFWMLELQCVLACPDLAWFF